MNDVTSDALRGIASNGCLHIDEAAGLTRPCTSAPTLSHHWCPNCLLEVAADRIDELQTKYDALVEGARQRIERYGSCNRCDEAQHPHVLDEWLPLAALLPEEQEAR